MSFEAYQPVLKQVHALLPAYRLVTLLADRGFVHERLLHTLQRLGWHFHLRLPGDTLVHLGAHHLAAVKVRCPLLDTFTSFGRWRF
ncbi:MAG: transposase [Ktedonobacteraceae bacterium]